MDLPVARKTDRQTIGEIIEPLAFPTSDMMDLGRDFTAELALQMFAKERESQARILTQTGPPQRACGPQPAPSFQRRFALHTRT
jgi:hypothetical protein